MPKFGRRRFGSSTTVTPLMTLPVTWDEWSEPLAFTVGGSSSSVSGSFSINACTFLVTVRSFKLDSLIVERKAFTVDAKIVGQRIFSIAAAIKAASGEKTFFANASKLATGNTSSFTASAIVRVTQVLPDGRAFSFTANATVRIPSSTKTFTASAIVRATGNVGSFFASATLYQNSGALSFSVNAKIQSNSGTRAYVINSVIFKSGLTGSFSVSAIKRAPSGTLTFTASAAISRKTSGSFSGSAIKKSSSGTLTYGASSTVLKTGVFSFGLNASVRGRQVASLTASAVIVGPPMWTAPDNGGNTVSPVSFVFKMPVSRNGSTMSFEMQIDTANTFNTANLRVYKTWIDQTNWEYWNGAQWVPILSSGVPNQYTGNNARLTLNLPIGTWYRRVRAAY